MEQPQHVVSWGQVGGRERSYSMLGSYPTNLVPLGPSWSTGLTRLSPSLRAGSFLGRWSLLCPQDNETNIYIKHNLTIAGSSGQISPLRHFSFLQLCSFRPKHLRVQNGNKHQLSNLDLLNKFLKSTQSLLYGNRFVIFS